MFQDQEYNIWVYYATQKKVEYVLFCLNVIYNI